MIALGNVFMLIGAGLLWVASVGVTLALGAGLLSLLRKERDGFWWIIVICTAVGGLLVLSGFYAVASGMSTRLAG